MNDPLSLSICVISEYLCYLWVFVSSCDHVSSIVITSSWPIKIVKKSLKLHHIIIYNHHLLIISKNKHQNILLRFCYTHTICTQFLRIHELVPARRFYNFATTILTFSTFFPGLVCGKMVKITILQQNELFCHKQNKWVNRFPWNFSNS